MEQESPHDIGTTAVEPVGEQIQRRRATRRLLRAEVFYLLGLVGFAVLAAFAYFNAYFGWDLRASRAVQSIPLPGIEALMTATSLFGNEGIPYVLTAITAGIFLIFRRRSEAAGLVVSTAGSAILNGTLKALIARPRPTSDLVNVVFDLPSLSFPSGHVTFYVSYFGFLFFVAYALLRRGSLVRRLALTLSALPVLLVGFSRVYLGAHWPSDTLGAYLIGGVWLGLSLHLYRYWKQRATFKAKAEGGKG
ncbi:MAG TPA: phosphatase PAP2 family protein [Pyrinomonadaceae bacterium]|jgi:undecaprenyl-diphosphatase